MIDTHAHIYDSAYSADYQEMVNRCKEAGVQHVILPNVDKETWAEIKAFHSKYPDFTSVMLGIHPTSIKEQKKSFEHHIDVAISKDLPICIHCRDSYAEIIDSLKKFKGKSIRGVVHAFSLYPENAKQYLEYGDFYFGLGGVITYKNAKFPERLGEIPLDRILLETDSPYLTPQPHRGKRNEPTYLVHIAEKIAQIYGVSPEEIKNKTTENAQRLFF